LIDPRRPRLVLGLQGLQATTHAGATQQIGISYAQAIARYHSDLIAGVSIDVFAEKPPLLNDELYGIPVVDSVDSIGRGHEGPLVFHSVAPANTAMTARQIWPRWAKDPSVGFVASAPRESCEFQGKSDGPAEHRRRRDVLSRLLRSADSVVTTSNVSALDVLSNAGVDRHRLFVAREATLRGYVRHPKGRTWARRALSDRIPVTSPFVLASTPQHKPRLACTVIEAYSLLSAWLRTDYQLVVLLSDDLQQDVEGLHHFIAERGLTGRVLVAASPGDDTRRLCFQACEVAVVASDAHRDQVRPALDAMACGAVTVVADTDELQELVREADARFSPASPESVASILTRSITDEVFREAQAARGTRTISDYSLSSVATQLLTAYEHAALTRR